MAFDCSPGIRNILSPVWENGAYVANGDIEAYAEALSRLMSDDELRQKIQRNGLDNIKRFSAEESAKQYDSLINKLCSK
jgi:glycosyltransferase involved in cell wall biosynthesis